MTYASYLYFFAFVVVAYAIYLMVPVKYRWLVLLAAGYTFYAVLNEFLTAFLIVTTVSTYLCGKKIGALQDSFNAKKKELSKDEKKQFKAVITKRKKLFVGLAVLINLGILVVLKYYNFFAEQVTGVINLFGIDGKLPLLKIMLPLGISYYTLQAIGYIVDLYRGKYKPEKNLAKLALFLNFFPQMTEGPIGRYNELAPQLYEGHRYSNENFTGGVTLMLWGFFKKLVISDRASFMANSVFNDYNSYSGTVITVAAILYTIQLYTDFSGCIDIMTGSAKIFGINLAENFRQPFFSKSVAEFWRRWHITLGTWFKDYVFYPVSLSSPFMKLSKGAQKHLNKFFASLIPSAAALLVVWMGTGLWHGASNKYIVYGLYYFVLILLGMLFEPVAVKLFEKLHINRKGVFWSGFSMVRTTILIVFGMMLFRANYVTDFFAMVFKVFTNVNFGDLVSDSMYSLGTDKYDFMVILIGVVILFVVAILKENGKNVLKSVATGSIPLKWSVMIGLIMAIVIFGAYGPDYGIVDTIYAQF